MKDMWHSLRSFLFRGHWAWEHPYGTCPAGNRHCEHYYWIRDKKGKTG
jgi:hypothetical protein